MTPRQFWTHNFRFSIFGLILRKVIIVLCAHDANTKSTAKSAFYARSVMNRKNISWLLSLYLTSQKWLLYICWPVLGGDYGEVDHLDWRPEKVVVQIHPWEPGKANYEEEENKIALSDWHPLYFDKKKWSPTVQKEQIYFSVFWNSISVLLLTIHWGCWQDDRFIPRKRLGLGMKTFPYPQKIGAWHENIFIGANKLFKKHDHFHPSKLTEFITKIQAPN